MEPLHVPDAVALLSVVGNSVEVFFNMPNIQGINNDNTSYISHIIPDNIIIYGLSNGLEDTVELLEYVRDNLRSNRDIERYSIRNCFADNHTYGFHLTADFSRREAISPFVIGFQQGRGLITLYTRDSRRWTDYINFEDNPFRGHYMSSFEFHITQKYSNNAVNSYQSLLMPLCRSYRGGRRLTRRRRLPPRRIASSRRSNRR